MVRCVVAAGNGLVVLLEVGPRNASHLLVVLLFGGVEVMEGRVRRGIVCVGVVRRKMMIF